MSKPKALNRQSAYQWYLGSAFWRERRVAAFRRAGGICERCKERPATQVHHLNYLRIFYELPSDLMALCDKCHAEMHQKAAANDNQLSLNFDAPAPEPETKSEAAQLELETAAYGPELARMLLILRTLRKAG